MRTELGKYIAILLVVFIMIKWWFLMMVVSCVDRVRWAARDAEVSPAAAAARLNIHKDSFKQN